MGVDNTSACIFQRPYMFKVCSPQSILIYTHKNVHPDFLPNKVPTLAVPLLATLNSLPKAYNYHGFVTCLHDQHCVQVRGVNQWGQILNSAFKGNLEGQGGGSKSKTSWYGGTVLFIVKHHRNYTKMTHPTKKAHHQWLGIVYNIEISTRK